MRRYEEPRSGDDAISTTAWLYVVASSGRDAQRLEPDDREASRSEAERKQSSLKLGIASPQTTRLATTWENGDEEE